MRKGNCIIRNKLVVTTILEITVNGWRRKKDKVNNWCHE